MTVSSNESENTKILEAFSLLKAALNKDFVVDSCLKEARNEDCISCKAIALIDELAEFQAHYEDLA